MNLQIDGSNPFSSDISLWFQDHFIIFLKRMSSCCAFSVKYDWYGI